MADFQLSQSGVQIQRDLNALESLADQYNPSGTYAIKDLVFYNGQLYRCNTAIQAAEAWTPAHWTAVNMQGLVTSPTTQELVDYISAGGATPPVPSWVDAVYPVGSIYMSVKNTLNPNNIFSGTTWVKIIDGAKLALSQSAPVSTGENHTSSGTAIRFKYTNGTDVDNNRFLGFYSNAAKAYPAGSYDLQYTGAIEPINLYADLTTAQSSIDIDAWRRTE